MGSGPDALYLALYVDDLFLLSKELSRILGVKVQLEKQFRMQDLGEAKFLLGLKIKRQPDGRVFLCQEKYAREVLGKFNMLACNRAATPLEVGKDFYKDPGPVADFVWEGVADGQPSLPVLWDAS